jgi:hypothetical protein
VYVAAEAIGAAELTETGQALARIDHGPLNLTRGHLLHAPVRVNDFCRPVRVNHHYAVAVQQGPALALFEPVEKPNTRAGVR